MSKDKRTSIMDAAKKSFSLFGYKGTSVDQIAKIANVGKGTIYSYFENKEVLLNEIIQTLIDEMKMVASKSIEEDSSVSENLHAALYGILTYRREHELLIKLSQEVREIQTQVAMDALESIENEVVSYIKSLLDKGMDNGKIIECDSEITAFAMFKMYVSLLVDWERKHQPLSNDKIFELFNLYFMKGLAK